MFGRSRINKNGKTNKGGEKNMGTLTKKDFIKFAISLSYTDDDNARKELENVYINIFSETNPRFDAQRFKKYVENLVTKRRLGI